MSMSRGAGCGQSRPYSGMRNQPEKTSMSIQRHFIGWDEPVTVKVRKFLLPQPPIGPADLDGLLVLVPTRQAGRRLREALALFCGQHGSALLSARVATPSVLLQPAANAAPEASPSVVRTLWAEILLEIDPAAYPGFLRVAKLERDFAWALDTGDMIQQLREEISDGGLRLGDAVSHGGEAFEEAERWQDMERLEALYLERLAGIGLRDPCVEKLQRAAEPTVPEGIGRIVVAAVPDPSPQAVAALNTLGGRIPVDVLVHAPSELKEAFDEWGRPLPTYWKSAHIDIPEADANIVPAGSPESQGAHLLRLIASEAHRFGPADIAVGVPDRSVMTELEIRLAKCGLPAFDPSDRALNQHAIYRLIESFAALTRDRSYAALCSLARHPDALAWLCAAGKVAALDLLTQLDDFQNEHLPLTMDEIRERSAANPPRRRAQDGEAFAALNAAAALVVAELDRFEASPSAAAATRAFLQRVFETRQMDARRLPDAEFRAAAAEVDDGLHELDGIAAAFPGRSKADEMLLLLRRLAAGSYHPETTDAVLDLEGWLELPWNDAPFLVVTGMNEGFVPDGRIGDVFLPDSLRAKLGLRDDAGRFARDAYLMTAFIEARRTDGRVSFIAGRVSREGDPLKPSRLLFRCPDEELPARAARLFGPVEESRSSPPATVSFKLDSRPPPDVREEDTRLERVSITALRDYLECPYRFYLKHVLGMQPKDLWKNGLDALDFGNLVHAALQQLGRAGHAHDDAAALADFLTREAERWVEQRYGSAPALPVRVALEAARRRLTAAAAVQAQLATEGWETVLTEKKFSMKLEGLTLSGRIDRVDRNSRTGTLRIIDYKSSDTAVAPAKAHLAPAADDTPPFTGVEVGGKLRRWIDLQLPLYRILLREESALQGPIETAYFNLPKATSETGVSAWEGLDDALSESARASAAAVARLIRDRVFWPPAARVRYDAFESLFSTTMEDCVDPPFPA